MKYMFNFFGGISPISGVWITSPLSYIETTNIVGPQLLMKQNQWTDLAQRKRLAAQRKVLINRSD